MLKFGSDEQRRLIYQELKGRSAFVEFFSFDHSSSGNVMDVMKSKYSAFLIRKLMKYCDKEAQTELVKRFQGRIPDCWAIRYGRKRVISSVCQPQMKQTGGGRCG